MITMYAGEVVEDAPVDELLRRPLHPYSSGLMRSLPRLSARKTRFPSIPGRVPSAREMPAGCRFAPRCTYAEDACRLPQVLEQDGERRIRCCRRGVLALPGAVA